MEEEEVIQRSSSPTKLILLKTQKSIDSVGKRKSMLENLEAMGLGKSIFAELAKELRNIEHCMEFFTDLATKN